MCVAKLSKNVGCLYIALMLKFYVNNYEAQFLDYFGSLIKEVSIPAPHQFESREDFKDEVAQVYSMFSS